MNVLLNLAHSDNFGLMYHDSSELELRFYSKPLICLTHMKCSEFELFLKTLQG